jgi:ribosomal protein S27AE
VECPDCSEDVPVREFAGGVHKECPAATGPRAIRDESIRCPNCSEMTMQKVPNGFKCGICGYLEKRK